MFQDLWKRMGLEGKRVLIVHHDDLGFLQAQNAAYWALGLPTGSVLVPGTWAPELCAQQKHRAEAATSGGNEGGDTTGAAHAKGAGAADAWASGAGTASTGAAGTRAAGPGAAAAAAGPPDIGVHLTLTSEWAFPRLRPLTDGPTLRDPSGYFWPSVEEVWAHVSPEDARAELEAQIAAAKQMGLDVTHLDTHMGAVLRPDLAQIYVDLALKERVPAFVPENLEDLHMPEPVRTALRDLLDRTPLPRVRAVDSYPVPPDQRRRWYVQTLSNLGPGVYHLIHHAAMATPEAQNLPDWKKRLADFEALQDPEVRRVVDQFTPLTYREVRDAMRKL